MSLWFGNAQTYTTIIAEPQRMLLVAALAKLSADDLKEAAAAFPDLDVMEEVAALKDLYEALPKQEAEHPNAYHSFVD